jgi:glycosyltransferase involved in cell wall biosynthesis
VIFGGAATPTLQAYYRRVWRLAEEAGLKVADSLEAKADVYLVANAPRRVINEAMDRARAFLHATINEHWGIAVAEAMARGLPVVVHKSGGAWTDLAEEGRYGLGYETAEEAVANLLTDGRARSLLSQRLLARISGFTFKEYLERAIALLSKL